jgi:hypothetical protein
MDLRKATGFDHRTTRNQSDLLCKPPIFLFYLPDIPFASDPVIVFLNITPVLFISFISIRFHHSLRVHLLHTDYLLEFTIFL